MCVTLLCYFSVAGERSLEKTIRVVINDLHYFLCIQAIPVGESVFTPSYSEEQRKWSTLLWLKFHWSVSYFAVTAECWAAGGKYWCRCHGCVSVVSYISKCCLTLSCLCSFLKTFLILTKITWIYLCILSLLV